MGCRWVFKLKKNPNGLGNRYKAHLIAKGYLQTLGFDFTETFSLVVKATSLRIILTIVLARGWQLRQLRQLNVNNAFLNGSLQEEVYMDQPPRFEQGKDLACKLHKALYGLKQATRAWFVKLKNSLSSLGFTSSKANQSLFLKNTTTSYIFILDYVDDIIITGSRNKELKQLIFHLNKSFSLKDLGELNYFLGIGVKRVAKGFHLSQRKYINDLLKKMKMNNANPLPTPMVGGHLKRVIL